jgi:methyltransferase-like protein
MNEHQHVANSIENERFELKNAANTLETAASSSKMLYKFHQNVANPLENERFQLQNVAKTVEMAASAPKCFK